MKITGTQSTRPADLEVSRWVRCSIEGTELAKGVEADSRALRQAQYGVRANRMRQAEGRHEACPLQVVRMYGGCGVGILSPLPALPDLDTGRRRNDG